MRIRLNELDREIGHVVNAIGKGLLSPALSAKLASAEAERATLIESQNERAGPRVSALLPNLEATYRRLVDSLENHPDRHVPRARAVLQGLVGGIRPFPRGQQHLIAELTLDGAQLLDGAGTKISVVAGAGFYIGSL